MSPFIILILFLLRYLFGNEAAKTSDDKSEPRNFVAEYLRLAHPFLKSKKLTENMKSLLDDGKSKRIIKRSETLKSAADLLSLSPDKLKAFVLNNIQKTKKESPASSTPEIVIIVAFNPDGTESATVPFNARAASYPYAIGAEKILADSGYGSTTIDVPFFLEPEIKKKSPDDLLFLASTAAYGDDPGQTPTTVTEDPQVMEEILKNLEEIREMERRGKRTDGLPCKVQGTWLTTAVGVLLNITSNSSALNVTVHDKSPPCIPTALDAAHWKFGGSTPFPKTGLLLLTGTNNKKNEMAAFIGECRICNGAETISGSWIIGHSSSNCDDQKAAMQVFTDFWRRETLTELRKKRLKSTSGNATGTDSTKKV